MFVEETYRIGLSDINMDRYITNTRFLAFLENVANKHSEIIGLGMSNIEETRASWILLSWHVKIIRRPKINELIKIKTASRKMAKFFAYRDYVIYDEDNNIIGIATSKWVYIDIDKQKLIKVPIDVVKAYTQEETFNVFDEEDIKKLEEPKGEAINKVRFKITKNLIDINQHLHNIYYMDLAKEVLPDNISLRNEKNEFFVQYNKEIKYGELVNIYHVVKDGINYVVIKSIDDQVLHAIIEL